MNPEQQRIKIAEACGWKKVYKGPEIDDCFIDPHGKYLVERLVPNYPNDLNAMHEAEKMLLRPTSHDNAMERDEKFVLWDNYIEKLASKMGRDDIAHATAAQRAEAFGLTLDLWTA